MEKRCSLSVDNLRRCALSRAAPLEIWRAPLKIPRPCHVVRRIRCIVFMAAMLQRDNLEDSLKWFCAELMEVTVNANVTFVARL